jgi:hypothetical protein
VDDVTFSDMDPARALDLGLQVGILPDSAEVAHDADGDEVGVCLIGDPIVVEPGMYDPID